MVRGEGCEGEGMMMSELFQARSGARDDDGTLLLSVPAAWAGRYCGRRRTGEHEGRRSYGVLSISMPLISAFLV